MNRKDFELSMTQSGMESKVIKNIFEKFEKMKPKWLKFIEYSFLPEEKKTRYTVLIKSKFEQLFEKNG